MIYVSGPGHRGPAVVANTYLEGTYSGVVALKATCWIHGHCPDRTG